MNSSHSQIKTVSSLYLILLLVTAGCQNPAAKLNTSAMHDFLTLVSIWTV
jgi:hypothetical protein